MDWLSGGLAKSQKETVKRVRGILERQVREIKAGDAFIAEERRRFSFYTWQMRCADYT